MSRELGRLNIDIAALSETDLPEEDQLIEKGTKPKNEKREVGVDFAIKSNLVENLDRPSGITDRIMKLLVPLPWGRFSSILSLYASTFQANEEVTLAYYGTLHEAITKIPEEENW